MKNKRLGFLILAISAFLLALTPSTRADAPTEETLKNIPEPLKAWEKWALWDDRDRDSPTPYSNAGEHWRFWPSRMGLRAEKTGGQFDLALTVFTETWVPLPGGAEVWPREVRVNDAPVAVLEHDGHPSVRLTPGTFHLTGAFPWTSMPQRILIPREIGIMALWVDGQQVDMPVWDEQGFVWLKREGTNEQADRDTLSVKVYAALEDGIPLWWRTEIELTVSGKSREEEIGHILPEGWKLAAVDSPIPVAVDNTGKMKVQVRAGKWVVHLDAFRFDNPREFHFAAGVKPVVGDELVAFRAQPEFRTVEIVGVPSVDVSQTTMPQAWRELPVYRWKTATPFQVEERMRGMGQQKPEGLHIMRELWLDENGRQFTFRDQISGQSQEIWRLDAAAGRDLGSVRSRGQGQLITRNAQNGASGVEIRARNLDLEATGRTARTTGMSATGWRSDADSVSTTLNLPPGWRLFALFGADWVHGDWLTAWTLLDLFVVLVFSLGVFRIWGFGAALLAFLGLGLSYHEPGAPRYLWLILLVPLALHRVVPEGWGKRIVGVLRCIAIVLLVLTLVPFVARQLQQALYPQLEVLRGTGWWPFVSSSEVVESADFANAPSAPSAAAPGGELSSPAFPATASIRHKLETIVIPKLEFREATIREAVDFLKKRSEELDTDSPPGDRGVNIILKIDSMGANAGIPAVPGLDNAQPGNPVDARITVTLTNIPLIEALKYVTGLANLKFKIEPYAVSIVPLSEPTDVLVTKEWNIPPDLIPRTPAAASPAIARDATKGGTGAVDRESAKNWLIANGVTFNGQASALYIVKSNRLVVRAPQDQLDLIDTMLTNASGAAPAETNNLQYDAKAQIQTGPGVPEWKWRTVSFGWNGPVSENQQVRPVLISLTLERVLTVLRVALLVILAAVMLGLRKLGGPAVRAAGKAAPMLIFALLAARASAEVTIPGEATLNKLRTRLLEQSDAYPNAAEIPLVTLTLKDRKVIIDSEVHCALRTAVPMPGRLTAWSPVTVLVDDRPEVSLRRQDGCLWIVVDKGVHHVHVEGSLANISDWDWTYILKPRQVKIDAPEWTYTGLKPDGTPEAQILFARKERAAAQAQASYERPDVQTVVVVDRSLELGLIWQVHNTVTRLSPGGKAAMLRIPLLPGESVLSDVPVKDGVVEVRLGAQDQSFSWESSLDVTNQLKLATRADDGWVERWHLVASPTWDVTLSGIAPIFERGNGDLVPVWQPWPGESVELSVSRPEAIAGATVTVSHTSYIVKLGKRQRTSQLELQLRCSLGEDFLVEVPGDAEISALTLDGKAIPVRKLGNKLTIPVHPGEQRISIGWKRNVPLGAAASADEVHLPVESANIQTEMELPEDRWTLWAHGPQRGPAVRFWGMSILALLAAFILGRLARSPLRILEWMLLLIGLTQIPLAAAIAVIVWLFFLVWRGSPDFQRLGNWRYNILQILLVFLTVAALGILLAAVGEGLLGRPEMFVLGNGSGPTYFRWFQPRSDGALPRCACVSISIWWYRLLMLLWALWLAEAVIRWLRKGWQSFVSGGVFHRKPKAVPVPPAISAPPMPSSSSSSI